MPHAGGKWDSGEREWVFPAIAAQRLRREAVRIYGDEPNTEPELITVYLREEPGSSHQKEIWWAGRLIAQRRYRDEPVEYGKGVFPIRGEFWDRGGSAKNPRIGESKSQVTLAVTATPAMRGVPVPPGWQLFSSDPDSE